MTVRTYPVLENLGLDSREGVSFVTVRWSGDFEHNISVSDDLNQRGNELVVIENPANQNYYNLGEALNEGIRRSKNDLVILVHEDVYLVPHWQQHFLRSITALEQYDPQWGLAGSVGWDDRGQIEGHWSDPNEYTDTLGENSFRPVSHLDEQILILRKSRGVVFDPDLPSIHNLGRDMSRSLSQRGLNTYVINAPTIHKYRDDTGKLILRRSDSRKIGHRSSLTWMAEKAFSDDYVAHKWRLESPDKHSREDGPPPESPLIILSRGGSGSRLASTLARDAGVFLGNDLNESGDCMEMVTAIYKAVVCQFHGRHGWQLSHCISEIRASAAEMISKAGQPETWGFKLPESILVLDILDKAFPNAKYLHWIRNPIDASIRRTHMTSRLDNEIGRIVVPASYRHTGRPVAQSLVDDPLILMAYGTVFQLNRVKNFLARKPAITQCTVRFEDALDEPERQLNRVAGWLELEPVSHALLKELNVNRAQGKKIPLQPTLREQILKILEETIHDFGYAPNT